MGINGRIENQIQIQIQSEAFNLHAFMRKATNAWQYSRKASLLPDFQLIFHLTLRPLNNPSDF